MSSLCSREKRVIPDDRGDELAQIHVFGGRAQTRRVLRECDQECDQSLHVSRGAEDVVQVSFDATAVCSIVERNLGRARDHGDRRT